MSFPWSVLIASGATLLAGGVGAVAGGVFALKVDKNRSARDAAAMENKQCLDAYMSLTTTARTILRSFRQVKVGLVATGGLDPEFESRHRPGRATRQRPQHECRAC